MRTMFKTSSALLALVAAAGMSVTPAMAQDASSSDGQSGAQTAPSQGDQTQSQSQSQGAGSQQLGDAEQQIDPETPVASVNGTDITQGDILQAVQSLPPQAQQMPPQMVYQIVLGQLVTRELILQAAQDEGIEPSSSQESQAAQGSNGEQGAASNERATIAAYIENKMEGRVTDEKVQQAYQTFEEENPDSEQSMEEMRPQLEQQVRQQEMQQITQNLREDADIVLYDENGNPVEPGQGQGSQSQGGSSSGDSSGGSSTGGGSGSDSSASGSSSQ